MVSVMQIILILALVIIVPLGLWNQKRMKKQVDYSQYRNSMNTANGNLSVNESKAKQYIETYKSSYPKESIKQGLVNMGINDAESQSYVDKYY